MILLEINQNDQSHLLHPLIMRVNDSTPFESFSMIVLVMRALLSQALLFHEVGKLLLFP